MQEQVKNAGLEHLIEFLGFQDKSIVLRLMHQAKCLIFPSIWYEGFPLTIAEAFASRLPVLAPKLGGMAEIVEDGVNGLHFEAGNVTDLAAKINWLTNHQEELTAMGNQARHKYQLKYAPDANYHQLIDIYERVKKESYAKCTKSI